MSDNAGQVLLSQEEIDSLLNMLSSENEVPGSEVRPFHLGSEIVRLYDFHQPDRLSKEHLRTLRMIHDNIARKLALQLSTKLRATVDVTLGFIETGPYASFIQKISGTPTAMQLVTLKPLPGRMLIQYGPRLADVLVDRLLGGAGSSSVNVERELTELELELLATITGDIINVIEDSWRGIIELNATLEETLTNPYFVQIALPTDTCVWVSFEIKINEQSSAMNYCIPASLLKPITPYLSPQTWMAGTDSNTDTHSLARFRKLVKRHLDYLSVEVGARLDGGELMLSDLITLRKGDVIPLQKHISEEVLITLHDRPKLRGRLGTYRGKVAVEITEAVMEESEEIE